MPLRSGSGILIQPVEGEGAEAEKMEEKGEGDEEEDKEGVLY